MSGYPTFRASFLTPLPKHQPAPPLRPLLVELEQPRRHFVGLDEAEEIVAKDVREAIAAIGWLSRLSAM